MTTWEKYEIFQTSEATVEAVNGLRNMYPRIKAWKTEKILHHLSLNWHKRDIIQNRLNVERMET